MIVSMTGFATRRGQGAGATWAWDLRSVNGKGFDLRLRLPEWIEGLEPLVRADVSRQVRRGNVTLALRVQREGGDEAPRVNPALLGSVLSALADVSAAAGARGISLSQPSSADVLALRGVLDTATVEEDTGPLRAALAADLVALIEDFAASRASEGAALDRVIAGQIETIERLTADAAVEAVARRAVMSETLRANLARVLDNAEGADEARVAQELAMLAVKADVTEEIDRLTAHVAAARALCADPAPVGRKLDFLMQEFNREANTLCSKAQSIALTRIGLDLKTVIDQMREQVQNVE